LHTNGIQEQNSYAGSPISCLQKKQASLCGLFEYGTLLPFRKNHYTGNPVRQDLINLENKKQEAYEYLVSNPVKNIIGIGWKPCARTINNIC
jgi:UDP-N-acetylglucosamine--N-acetylmuramyl-(pentapeptide) pyrophosphoryl-undecaprenol N-acetylglucosamine transferase